MRTAAVLIAAVAASGVAIATPFVERQYEGCEEFCNVITDWALTCRTDVKACMDQCNAELITATDNCYSCLQEKNPDQATKVSGYIDTAHSMCGTERPAEDADSASASATGTGSASAPSSTAHDDDDGHNHAASGSANASGASATGPASTGSATSPTSGAPASTSSAVPAAATTGNAAGRVGVSFGAAAVAAAALLL